MAKKNEKLAALETEIESLKGQVTAVQNKALENGKAMVGLALYIRDAYVKTLTPQIINDSPFGQFVIDVLKRLEGKSPSVKCTKCDGLGVVDIRGNWMICFACVCGRLLGKPGSMHVIDRKVQLTHEAALKAQRENRFSRYAPSQEEIEAAEKAKAEKAKAKTESLDAGIDITS